MLPRIRLRNPARMSFRTRRGAKGLLFRLDLNGPPRAVAPHETVGCPWGLVLILPVAVRGPVFP